MTLLGLVVLSHTPKRAVRGSVLSMGLGLAWAWPWAKPGVAVTSAAVTMAVQTNRSRIFIDSIPFGAWQSEKQNEHT